MSNEVSSKDVKRPDGDWCVVLDDGGTFSTVDGSCVVYLTDEMSERLCRGGTIWSLEDEFPDNPIKPIDLGHIFDFYKESYGSVWEDEMEKVNE